MRNLSLQERLARTATFCGEAALAAYASSTNFGWLALAKKVQLPLFDADLICGSLSSLGIYHLLGDMGSERRDYPFEHLIGLETIRYHISNVDYYYIPPGSAADLLIQQRLLSGRLSDAAQGFLAIMDGAGKAPDPIEFIRQKSGSTQAIPNILRENLTRLASAMEEKSLLDSALAKCVTILDFDLPERNLRPGKIFSRTYHYLRGTRKKQWRGSDIHDAINIELLAQLCANGGRFRGTGVVPCLITGTDALVTLMPSLMGFLGVPDDYPELVRKYPYLLVSQGLRLRTENRYKIAAQEALLFMQQTDGLRRLIQRMLAALRFLPEKDRVPESLDANDWQLLMLKSSALLRDWPEVFGSESEVASKDRVRYLNALLSADLCQQLESASPVDVRRGIAALVQRMRETRNAVYELQRLISDANRATRLLAGSDTLFSATMISCTGNSGSALRDLRLGHFTECSADLDALRRLHDLRFIAHCSILARGGLLALDSWRDPSDPRERSYAVLWSHEEDADTLIDAGVALIGSFTSLGQHETFRYRLASMELILEDTIEYSGSGDALRSLLRSRCPNVEYIEFNSHAVTFFADVVDQEGSEKQIGLKFHKGTLRGRPLDILVQWIYLTSIYPLEPDYYRNVIGLLATSAKAFVEVEFRKGNDN